MNEHEKDFDNVSLETKAKLFLINKSDIARIISREEIGLYLIIEDYKEEVVEYLISLLGKEKAVKPKTDIIDGIKYRLCGNCDHVVNHNYCDDCGKKLDWGKDDNS